MRGARRRRRRWRAPLPADDALVAAVVIEHRTCPCCRCERPDVGRGNDCRAPVSRPHLAAVAGIVHQEDLWQLCRGELTGVDVRADGWDIRGRWFGVVVVATPRLGELPRGETIPWRVLAAQIAPRQRRSMG